MEAFKPWLNQGDVFRNLPLYELKVNERTGFQRLEGDAWGVLLTDNCILDKRTSSAGLPSVRRLHFAGARLLEKAQLGDDRERRLRAGELNPAELVYLPLGTEGDYVAEIGLTMAIPASHFALEGTEDPDDSDDPFRVQPTDHDSRVLTMDKAEKRLLQEKLALFWAHAELAPVCAQCWRAIEELDGEWSHVELETDHVVVHTRSRAAQIAAHLPGM
jgi:hypothetical protein